MSIWLSRDDFDAIAIREGVREVATEDAWLAFADFDGSVREFVKSVRESKAHWFAAVAAEPRVGAAVTFRWGDSPKDKRRMAVDVRIK